MAKRKTRRTKRNPTRTSMNKVTDLAIDTAKAGMITSIGFGMIGALKK